MAANPLIRLQQVTRTYPMGGSALRALDGITLDIVAGAYVAIMGTSGSGKSTLMNVLGCLDRPTGGRYWLAGRDVAALDRRALADIRNRLIGFVFQNFNLLARTSALENVELPLLYAGVAGRERRQRATAALQRVGLGDRLTHHPSQLSGGQQQRVAIARALIGRAPLILADEPTGNLDSRTSADIMRLLQDLNDDGITVILVTHEAEIAAHASRVIQLRDGVIASDQNQPAMRE
jgi:putative ABC transport system ATP-binding protein